MKMQKGFTLIELLVVIAIIGILTSVVLGSIQNTQGKKETNTEYCLRIGKTTKVAELPATCLSYFNSK